MASADVQREIEFAPSERRLEVLLAEYKQLKTEQETRIGYRDNLVYATLAASGAVLAFAIGRDGSSVGLLVLPVAMFILGATSVSNDAKISAIGDYIRVDLRRRVSSASHAEVAEVFAWEELIRARAGRTQIKLLQLIANLATFVAPGCVALWRYLTTVGPVDPATLIVVGIDAVLMLWTLSELIGQSDLTRSRNAIDR
jgi:hypothetical protein